jgi:hypothetical protein
VPQAQQRYWLWRNMGREEDVTYSNQGTFKAAVRALKAGGACVPTAARLRLALEALHNAPSCPACSSAPCDVVLHGCRHPVCLACAPALTECPLCAAQVESPPCLTPPPDAEFRRYCSQYKLFR